MRLSRIIGVAVLTAVFTSAAPRAEAQTGFVIQTINLNKVHLNAATGVVRGTGGTVTGLLEGVPFTTDITKFVLSPGQGGSCTVLDLALAPIHISLLGLHVDTSAICLTITAFPNQGILGNLLCGLAGGTLTLDNFLNSQGLLSGLSTILNQALDQGQNVPQRQRNTVCTGRCRILDLVLGPLTLNIPLLGVQVDLNNCSNGPVEVCVSATAGEGLLGRLLCGLSGQGLTLQDIANLIANVLAGL